MTKLYSFLARTTTDTDVKTVTENQIIQIEAYNYDRYAVLKITQGQYGYHYHLINLRNLDMYTAIGYTHYFCNSKVCLYTIN